MNWNDILRSRESGWTILVRLLVGLVVFLPEGIQKLAYPSLLGAGRFAKIGIPYPDVMGPFVGVVEVVCGALIILGLLTRLAVVPLIVVMIVALISTKLPILVGHDVWMFHLSADMKRTGFWSAAHESRADLTMLLGCIYLLIVGGGKWSLDNRLAR
jgi:putative oxidoreductase